MSIDGLYISDVRIRPAEIESRPEVLANATVVLNRHFLVRGILVYRRANGKIGLEMPRIRGSKQWFDAAHPISSTMRGYMERIVGDAYFEWMGEQVEQMETTADALP